MPKQFLNLVSKNPTIGISCLNTLYRTVDGTKHSLYDLQCLQFFTFLAASNKPWYDVGDPSALKEKFPVYIKKIMC